MFASMNLLEPSDETKSEKLISSSLLENLCQCQICCTNFNETTRIAQLLHCGHTFCMECIGNIQKYGNSAYLECPTCRAETKCDLNDIATNFLAMEMIRKLEMMGPAEAASVKEPKRARAARRERTIDEMVDEQYRQLIADVKGELMLKFEDLRERLRKSAIQSAQSELEDLSSTVMEAVRDAYDGISDTEEEESEEDDDVSGDTDNKEDDDDLSVVSMSTAMSFASAKSGVIEEARHTSPNSSIVVIKNPLRSSDESSDSSSGDESDSEEDSDEDNISSSD
ncbi:hypothetical protein GCK72_001080 [Caenorhabditis remanei]|uniref:RING-type domain-containing protein n=1 Tax=Caenorhabditis remanei TaxID=31234 RepID=A0A6A5HRL1_CAERE|nr:hypothetical protein GCK72_001080 [Caenorhabditis remanei]KAF1769264.1 hypothetical protein GCK72_001080 [Caenorhabditis remanei]